MPQKSKANLARARNIQKANTRFTKNTVRSYFRRRMTKKLFPKSNIIIDDIINNESLDSYYKVDKKDTLRAILVGIIKKDLPLTPCSHFYVGASFIYSLLSCKLTPKAIHGFLRSTENRHFGSAAEISFKKKYPDQKKVCYGSTKIPFLCGSPDFLIGNKIIEIKSFRKEIEWNREILLQTLTFMEICGVDVGEIHLYHTIQYSETRYDVKLVKVIGIRKQTSLFYDEFIFHVCKGYANYLGILLAAQNITVDIKEIQDIATYFINYARNHDSGYVEVPRMRISKVCRAMAYVYYPTRAVTKRSKGFRWSEADTRYISFQSQKSDFTAITSERVERFGGSMNENDVHSNYILSDHKTYPLDANLRSFYDTSRSSDKNPPSEVVVNEIINDSVEKIAISIDSVDIKNIFSYYFDISEIGVPINDFDFI
jgi:hypothetical protein